MKGSHRIIVESRKVKYDFIIKRNITILTGDSGSGKTVLIDLIHDTEDTVLTAEYNSLVTVHAVQLIVKTGKEN